MRILVHDYAGHAFQWQLSSHLSRLGHDVIHAYCTSYATGRGSFAGAEGSASVRPLTLRRAFDKHSLWRRPFQEVEYARLLRNLVAEIEPDVVVSGNTPLFVQWSVARSCKKTGVAFVFWMQDVISLAVRRYVGHRNALLGRTFGALAQWLEVRALRSSDAIITIAPAFDGVLAKWGIARDAIACIPNWAPLEDVPVADRDNAWAQEKGLVGRKVILYSGTLGLKHEPELLFELARQLETADDALLVVLSGGRTFDELSARATTEGVSSLVALPWVDYDLLPQALGAADVLLAVLERGAGAFSVPSKILTYLCAGRPVLAALPQENLAAQVLLASGGGVVVPPGDAEALATAASELLCDDEKRRALGSSARAHAERDFDITVIGARFAGVLRCAVGGSSTQSVEAWAQESSAVSSR